MSKNKTRRKVTRKPPLKVMEKLGKKDGFMHHAKPMILMIPPDPTDEQLQKIGQAAYNIAYTLNLGKKPVRFALIVHERSVEEEARFQAERAMGKHEKHGQEIVRKLEEMAGVKAEKSPDPPAQDPAGDRQEATQAPATPPEKLLD